MGRARQAASENRRDKPLSISVIEPLCITNRNVHTDVVPNQEQINSLTNIQLGKIGFICTNFCTKPFLTSFSGGKKRKIRARKSEARISKKRGNERKQEKNKEKKENRLILRFGLSDTT